MAAPTCAGSWRQKLWRAILRPGRDRLRRHVEVDETFWGAKEASPRGRQPGDKALVAVAVEQVGRRGLGRIRLRQIPDASAESLQALVEEAVEPGGVFNTDGWISYDRLEKRGYRHRIMFLRGHPKSPAGVLPRSIGSPGSCAVKYRPQGASRFRLIGCHFSHVAPAVLRVVFVLDHDRR